MKTWAQCARTCDTNATAIPNQYENQVKMPNQYCHIAYILFQYAFPTFGPWQPGLGPKAAAGRVGPGPCRRRFGAWPWVPGPRINEKHMQTK